MILHFVRCTVDLWHVISMFGYTIGLCQSPLDPRYEILYEALVINGQMSSALLLHTLSARYVYCRRIIPGHIFHVHSIHVNAMKTCLSVYVKHFIQSRCKWSFLSLLYGYGNTTWLSVCLFSFFPAFSLLITATMRRIMQCVVCRPVGEESRVKREKRGWLLGERGCSLDSKRFCLLRGNSVGVFSTESWSKCSSHVVEIWLVDFRWVMTQSHSVWY